MASFCGSSVTPQGCPSGAEQRRLFFFFLFDFDAEGFQEL
jgi:hypothetical protein